MIFTHDLLKDRVALVTGGGTGIGRIISRELARHGAHVAIASRSLEHHSEAVAEMSSLGVKTMSLQGDVRDPEQMQQVIQQVGDEWGSLDILVNNAAGNFLCKAEDLSPNGWKSVVDIVLNGTFVTSKAVLPIMKAQGAGNIVNIGATYAWLAAPFVSHSGAAKAGVINLTRSLAVEWARYGIRVNCVTPGPIDETEGVRRLVADEKRREMMLRQIPLRRLGRREEIAWAILFLISPAGAYITGENLVVDGGMWLGASSHFG